MMSKMPMLFIGHGSPMNAIEDNHYTRGWRELAEKIPRPRSIISISAHWYTNGTRLTNAEHPKPVYDMYGFPKELYDLRYDPPGNPALAAQAKSLIGRPSSFDSSWGLDHGSWSVLVHLYPEKDIPVFQISIDAAAPPEVHYQIGRDLRPLRDQGVLLFASGNVVHNLQMVDWNAGDRGFDWAEEFDAAIKRNVERRNHGDILRYQSLGRAARLSVPTPDHFYPLL